MVPLLGFVTNHQRLLLLVSLLLVYCAVDQEFGVHCILVSLYTLSWVVPPRGATRATVSTGQLNYFSNPVALQGMPF